MLKSGYVTEVFCPANGQYLPDVGDRKPNGAPSADDLTPPAKDNVQKRAGQSNPKKVNQSKSGHQASTFGRFFFVYSGPAASSLPCQCEEVGRTQTVSRNKVVNLRPGGDRKTSLPLLGSSKEVKVFSMSDWEKATKFFNHGSLDQSIAPPGNAIRVARKRKRSKRERVEVSAIIGF